DGLAPKGAPRVTAFPSPSLVEGRVALVLDTVVDTGATAATVSKELLARGATAVRLACLVDKKARRRAAVVPDWRGFEAGDEFLVGYGLDAAGAHRFLPFLAAIDPRPSPPR